MTQIFDEAGKVIPVTVIQAGPCTVVQKKTEEKDGFDIHTGGQFQAHQGLHRLGRGLQLRKK